MSEPNDNPAPSGTIRAQLFGRTDVGQIREHNEDNFLIADLTERSRKLKREDRDRVIGPKGNVFGVCDGMGGAAAGEVASQMAVDLIYEQLVEQDQPETADEFARNLVRAVEEAGLKIYHEARADRSRRGMGTTATIAGMIDSRLFLAQVGDSRAYILRGTELVQVTRDQSLVNQLIEAGQLTEEEAETFEHNNIILQALGTAETVQVDLTRVDLRQGDVLLVCSDGLSGMVRAPELKQVLLDTPDPVEACKGLTNLANEAGGHDNITVIVVLFSGDGLPPPDDGDKVTYQKYAPGADSLTATTRGGVSPFADYVHTPPPSAEAARETRDLVVSHTMIGTLTPDLADTDPEGGRYGKQGADDGNEVAQGLPAPLVAAIVVICVALVGLFGFYFLR